jgi:hypothetical protein
MLFKSRKVYHQDDYQGKRNEKNGKEKLIEVHELSACVDRSI